MHIGKLASNTLQFRIVRCDYLPISPRWRSDDAYSSSTRIFYIESGSGWLRTDTETIILKPGYAYVIPSHLHFAYGTTGMKKLYFLIKLTTQDHNDLLAQLGRIAVIPYTQEDFRALLEGIKSTECIRLIKMQAILYETICKAASTYELPPVTFNPHSELVLQIIRYINAAPSLKLSTKSIAQALFVSESNLRNTFRKEMNTTLGKYIDDCVFLRAKSLLMDTQLSIAQIANQLGFSDQFYFSRRFKQRYRATPSQFRKSQPEENT